MALLHHSTATRTEEPMTDVMASNATVVPAPDTSFDPRDRDFEEAAVMRVPGTSVGFGAALALLVAAWAGLVPFIGPTFGFSADGSSSWTWNEVHLYGALIPGAVGVLACLFILTLARRPLRMASSFSLGWWGFVLFLCGAWLTAVPVAWPVLAGGYFQAASPSMTLLYWLGCASGPGVLIAAFGAYAMGRANR